MSEDIVDQNGLRTSIYSNQGRNVLKKYINLYKKLGGARGVKRPRNFPQNDVLDTPTVVSVDDKKIAYKKEVYKKTNEIVETMHEIHGKKILEIMQGMCKTLINVTAASGLLDEYVKIYNKKTSSVFISGSIDIPDVNELREMNIETTLTNIRSCMTFIDIFIKLIESKSSRFKGLVYFFDNFIRQRKKEGENSSKDFCLKEIKVPGKLASVGCNVKPEEHCEVMTTMLEEYSVDETNKWEHVKDKDSCPIVNSGVNIFEEPLEHNTLGVFAAGTSGHTFDMFLIFNIFYLHSLDDDHKKNTASILILIGCLIWMSNYYHHSLREILTSFTIFNNDDYEIRNIILTLFTKLDLNKVKDYNKVLEVYDMIKSILLTNIDENVLNDINTNPDDELLNKQKEIFKSLVGESTENGKIHRYNTTLDKTINDIHEKLNKFIKNNKEISQLNIPDNFTE